MMDELRVWTREIFSRSKIKTSYKSVFSTAEGQVVLRHIMKRGFVFDSTVVPGDPEATKINEGSRRLALGILKYAQLTERQILDEQQHVYDQTHPIQ